MGPARAAASVQSSAGSALPQRPNQPKTTGPSAQSGRIGPATAASRDLSLRDHPFGTFRDLPVGPARAALRDLDSHRAFADSLRSSAVGCLEQPRAATRPQAHLALTSTAAGPLRPFEHVSKPTRPFRARLQAHSALTGWVGGVGVGRAVGCSAGRVGAWTGSQDADDRGSEEGIGSPRCRAVSLSRAGAHGRRSLSLSRARTSLCLALALSPSLSRACAFSLTRKLSLTHTHSLTLSPSR